MTDNNKHPKMTLEQAIEFAKTSGGVRFLVTPEQVAEIQKYAKEHDRFIVPDKVFAISIEPSSKRPPVDFFYWAWDTISWNKSKLPEITLDLENNTTNRHPHAELMMQYAQDAMETDRPWERWEQGYYKNGKEHDYQPCTSNPTWKVEWCYRRKPKTININGFEVPEPLKHLDFTKDFPVGLACVNLLSQNNFYSLIYEGHGINEVKDKLEKGLLHLTKEAAELHAKALLSFTKKRNSHDYS